VAAAFNRIAREGFEGLRTRDVAADVGLNVATLHYYFPTKEGLIRGVVGYAMNRFRSTLAPAATPGGQLAAHFAGVRRLHREEPELFAVMGEVAQRAARDPAIAAIFAEMTEAWHTVLRALIKRTQADGAIDQTLNPDATASLVIATLRGLFMVPVATTSQAEVARSLIELERLIGLGGRARARPGAPRRR